MKKRFFIFVAILATILLATILLVSCKNSDTKKCETPCKDSIKVHCDTLKQADTSKVAME